MGTHPIFESDFDCLTEMSNNEINKKVISFEHYVNEVLKKKLREIMDKRDKVIEEQAQYLRLSETVEQMKNKTKLKTKVDLGCSFFVQVHLGSGIYTELD